jgi:hypothetical protein
MLDPNIIGIRICNFYQFLTLSLDVDEDEAKRVCEKLRELSKGVDLDIFDGVFNLSSVVIKSGIHKGRQLFNDEVDAQEFFIMGSYSTYSSYVHRYLPKYNTILDIIESLISKVHYKVKVANTILGPQFSVEYDDEIDVAVMFDELACLFDNERVYEEPKEVITYDDAIIVNNAIFEEEKGVLCAINVVDGKEVVVEYTDLLDSLQKGVLLPRDDKEMMMGHYVMLDRSEYIPVFLDYERDGYYMRLFVVLECKKLLLLGFDIYQLVDRRKSVMNKIVKEGINYKREKWDLFHLEDFRKIVSDPYDWVLGGKALFNSEWLVEFEDNKNFSYILSRCSIFYLGKTEDLCDWVFVNDNKDDNFCKKFNYSMLRVVPKVLKMLVMNSVVKLPHLRNESIVNRVITALGFKDYVFYMLLVMDAVLDTSDYQSIDLNYIKEQVRSPQIFYHCRDVDDGFKVWTDVDSVNYNSKMYDKQRLLCRHNAWEYYRDVKVRKWKNVNAKSLCDVDNEFSRLHMSCYGDGYLCIDYFNFAEFKTKAWNNVKFICFFRCYLYDKGVRLFNPSDCDYIEFFMNTVIFKCKNKEDVFIYPILVSTDGIRFRFYEYGKYVCNFVVDDKLTVGEVSGIKDDFDIEEMDWQNFNGSSRIEPFGSRLNVGNFIFDDEDESCNIGCPPYRDEGDLFSSGDDAMLSVFIDDAD